MTRNHTGPALRRRPDGPPAGVLAVVVFALTVASVVAWALGSPFWNGFFVFGASVPLGIYAATVYARQLRLGIRVPGPGIGLTGGVSASIFLAITGLLQWAQADVPSLPTPLTDLVTRLAFALGGVGFTCGLGLLISGIAVPSLILRLVPRLLAWPGLVLGALGEIAFFALIWPDLDAVLPVVRFGGLAWLAVVGFLLPHDRRDVAMRTARVAG